MSSGSFRTYWVCVASRWAVPPTPCAGRGINDKGAEKHILATGHPTFTTTRQDVADRLAGPTDRSKA